MIHLAATGTNTTPVSRINDLWGFIMGKISRLFTEKQESDSFSKYLAPENQLPPEFNAWKDALEKDKDYLEKREKELDDELGRDRLL